MIWEDDGQAPRHRTPRIGRHRRPTRWNRLAEFAARPAADTIPGLRSTSPAGRHPSPARVAGAGRPD